MNRLDSTTRSASYFTGEATASIIDRHDYAQINIRTRRLRRRGWVQRHYILLVGSPGIDRRLKRARYGQLHSRFTLANEIQPLSSNEMRLFISHKCQELNLPLTADDAVSAAIMRIAPGNFRALTLVAYCIDSRIKDY